MTWLDWFILKVNCELEELRKNMMIPRPKGQKGLYNSQGEVEEPGPTDREYIGSGGERGEKVDEGDNWTIGQVEHKIPTTGQTVHEGDKREPDVKPSSLLNSTDPGFLFWLRQYLKKC